jgi:transglutaminase-like putative cysteine protease
MKIKIIHLTEYTFNSEVFLEPHYFRFKPKFMPFCTLESFKIDVHPNPAGTSHFMDVENNMIHFCWFEDTHRQLVVETRSVLDISDFNPFNFLVYPNECNYLPFKYSHNLKNLLGPALSVTSLSNELIQYGEELKGASKNNTIDFILNLTKQISADFVLESRMTGQPHEPDITFNLRKGSCRDLTWFQIQLLRYMGIAARFVSGYFYIPSEKPEFELHAWVEAYIPGAGWIGFDPSHGIVSGNDHIPIASSADFRNTMPVSGSVRGDAASELKTELKIEVII